MKILVVEDEPGIAAFIKQGLEEEAYFVEIVEDGLLHELGVERRDAVHLV